MLTKQMQLRVQVLKALDCKSNQRSSLKWMFPSGVNYFAIARAERDGQAWDSLRWMIPSGVNYRPKSTSQFGLSLVSG